MNTYKLLVSVLMLVSVLLAACAPAATPLAPTTVPPTEAPTADPAQAEKLLGSWQVEVTTSTQSTFPALLTFIADGSLITDEPGDSPFETSGHGNWISKDSGEIAYTFVAFIGSADGLSATIKVVGTLKFDPDKDSWIGPFKVAVTDPKGQVMVSDRGTFNLTRIAVESIQ